jgi:membrane protease YdiL (CAAX protease family)
VTTAGQGVAAAPSAPVRAWSLAIFAVALMPIYAAIAYLAPGALLLDASDQFFAAALIAVALAMAPHGRAAFGLLGFRRTRLRFVLLAPVVTLALGFVLGSLIPEPARLQEYVAMVGQPGRLGAALVSFGGLSPLAEEVLFRGLLYAWLDGRWGPRIAVVGSGVAFGAAHQELAYIAATLPLGLFFGWLRWRSNSLWPSLAAHAIEGCGFVLTVRYLGA